MDNHIEINDGIPMIKGRQLKVKMVAQMYLAEGVTLEDVIEQYDLAPAQIYAALAYYYDHIDYFQQQAAETQPLIEQVKQATEARLERLRARIHDKG